MSIGAGLVDERARPLDARLWPAALAVWAGSLAGISFSWQAGLACCGSVAAVALAVGWRVRSPPVRRAAAAVALCVLAGFTCAAVRAAPVWDGPVSDLGRGQAYVELHGVVTRDPAVRSNGAAGQEIGRASYVLTRLRVDQVTGRGRAHDIRVPVLVVADDLAWSELLPGQRVRASGRLAPPDHPRDDVAAVFRPRSGPEEVSPPGLASRATEPFRQGLRDSVAGADADARALVPGLVIGDESLMTDDLRDDMTVTGLSHLVAASGSNVAIILIAALGLARWLGLRGYALPVLGVLCVLGFVFLARPDPSVLRAAAMGVVAVVGFTAAGRRRGLPSLAVAITVLLLVDPWLARGPGFVLSVLATAGLLLLAPAWQQAMSWLPRPLAAAVAVPLAAQIACTPVLLGLFGEFSLAALPANLLAAPAVAPATVLGVAAAAVSPAVPWLAAVLGWLAALPAWWIAALARWFADQPGTVLSWPGGPGGVTGALALAVVALLAVPMLLRHPVMVMAAATVLVIALLRAAPTPGWPPPGWLVVACDVGQGDTVALRAGERAAVVVDAGPEPRLARRCLDSLGVRHVPLLILTHFHADHVAGLSGVLAGRIVDQALVSPLRDPADTAAKVGEELRAAGVPVTVALAGERRQVGRSLELLVLWPRRFVDSPESASNNASVVVDADVDGLDVLLTGDLEPTAQRALLRATPGLTAEVLKVPHHGSPKQDPGLLAGVGAQAALVSVGDNTYGHPSGRALDTLKRAGVRVFRTDRDGSVAVVRTPSHGLGVVTSGGSGA